MKLTCDPSHNAAYIRPRDEAGQVATARNLLTGAFIQVGDGWSADKPS
jgi:hypothetical protein